MKKNKNRYGLVACGGGSTRMGTDKGLLTYHEKPQRYHAFDLLGSFCEATFLSCNDSQAAGIHQAYPVLTDAPLYGNIGPMAALLTAFQKFPDKGFLLIGCDYPFLSLEELNAFSIFSEQNQRAAAFYRHSLQLYEPLLAWYPVETYPLMLAQFKMGNYSLQKLLRSIHAAKYLPDEARSMTSIDSQESYASAKNQFSPGAIKEKSSTF